MIVQRDVERFWSRIFQQNFNFKTDNIKVRFAGEAGADLGGPLREFLTLCMRDFNLIPGLFIGSGSNVSLKLVPECLDRKPLPLANLLGWQLLQ